MTDLVGGAVVGALFGEALKFLIDEAKKVKAFKSLFKELVSTMERLVPLTEKIDASRDRLDLDVGELKELKETIERANIVVKKCSRVRWFHICSKSKLQGEIVQVNTDMLKFCQMDLQLIQHKYQLQSMEANNTNFQILNEKVDRLIVPAQPVSKDLCSVPKLNMVPVGLDWPLRELKKKLLDDSVNSLVVSASPGCGKTTLVTQLCHDEDIKREFKNIFFTVVSSTPNFRVIVQDLLHHNGYGASTFENDLQAGNALRNLLDKLKENSEKTLLVLDDVWNGAESLLRKFGITSPDFKILVTSRFEFQSFGPTYHLKPLEEGDAKALLIQWASRPDHASPAEYEELLQNILKRCNGIPILIEVVGASLKGRSLSSWKGLVESWSEGETILDINTTVLECLQPSFNALKPQLKECFLDMGLFLEDQKIRASVIIDIWVELYGKGSTVCMKYLEDFASQNLLKVVPLASNKHEDGFYNDFLVTQHDTLRELAIYQTESEGILERKRLNLEIREDTFPDWCLNPRHAIVNASLLSISTDDLFSSSWVEMDCPNVKALVLNLSSADYKLPSFIAEMKKLKVLIITNHGSSSVRLSNLSCLSSLPNLKRIRFEKVSITLLDIPKLGLKSLEKLSLWLCHVVEVLNESEVDVSKTLQSLQEIEIDCCNLVELPYWISQVVSLKKLSVTNCNKLCRILESFGNLGNLEMLRLSSCPSLLELPETIEKLSKLRFLDVSGGFQLKKLPLEIGNLQKLEKISMRDCYRCELPDSVKKLENLEVKCDEETAFLWKRFKPKMMNLTITEEETEHNLNLF
ncbi:putative disease resistance protein [Cardamine amara subsp. amara]|uniref:Disease resistance protein n=1 Tax=Cardamine amara subsp. amara TaxID=228776 RepID=A0ABD0ZYP9_CARAN